MRELPHSHLPELFGQELDGPAPGSSRGLKGIFFFGSALKCAYPALL